MLTFFNNTTLLTQQLHRSAKPKPSPTQPSQAEIALNSVCCPIFCWDLITASLKTKPGQDRQNQARSGQAWLDQTRPGQVRLGQSRQCQNRLGQARPDLAVPYILTIGKIKAISGWARPGQARSRIGIVLTLAERKSWAKHCWTLACFLIDYENSIKKKIPDGLTYL